MIFFCIFIIFSFTFVSPFTYSVLGEIKADMILKNYEKFCSSTYKAFESIFTNSLLQVFFAKMKYSLTNSKFQRAFGRYFRRKNHFSTNHTWELEECQMIFLKIKKEAPTFIVSAYHMSLLILKNSCGKSTGVLVIFFIPFSSFLRLTIR